MCRLNAYAFLILLLFLFGISQAETTGNISLEDVNVSLATGLIGYTVNYCNSTSDCADYKCFLDYDGLSGNGYKGWCHPSVAKCAHSNTPDITWYSAGYSTCYGNYIKSCNSDGTWGSVYCSEGCENATCKTTPSSTSTTDTTNITTNITTRIASIRITRKPADFEIKQGENITKKLEVENNGNITLHNISLNLSGIDKSTYTITPKNISSLGINKRANFTMEFRIPGDFTIKTYIIEANIETSNKSVTASITFNIKVLPSNQTIIYNITPLYNAYISKLYELRENITFMESMGADTTELWNLFNSISYKLNQTNESMRANDYYTANQLLGDVGLLINELEKKIGETEIAKPPQEMPWLIIIIILIIIVVVIAYLFWPTSAWRGAYKPAIREKNLLKRIKEKLKIKKEERFRYSYRA